MSAEETSRRRRALDEALRTLASSASDHIPGVSFASITLRGHGCGTALQTLVATDPAAERADALQYQLQEGPCLAVVTHARMVLVADLATAPGYPTYGPEGARLGIRSQAAVQLFDDAQLAAGLNLYSRELATFDSSTILYAALFSTQLVALHDYAHEVDNLHEALETRTDIGTAVGIVMERYSIDRSRAFAVLARHSSQRNVKVRLLSQQLIDGSFRISPDDASLGDGP